MKIKAWEFVLLAVVVLSVAVLVTDAAAKGGWCDPLWWAWRW